MRFVFGQGWVHLFDETNGEDTNGATGGAAGGDDDAGGGADDDAATTGGEDDDAAAGAAGDDAGKPKDMLEAITQGLAKTAPKVDLEEDPEKKAADAAAAAAKAEKHANGAPKKDAAGNELDDKGVITKKAEAPKAKTSTELQLSKDQLAALKPESRARFAEVISTLKAKEAEVLTLTERMKPLEEARDGIVSVLEETGTTSDQLSSLLEFNRMLQSDNPKDLEQALKAVEAYRGHLYTALGREPDDGGIDLLADFPDLKKQVEDSEITRQAALEIAQGRRERASAAAQRQQAGQQQQTAQQAQKAQDNALSSIDAWVKQLAKDDIDYKAKEAKVIDQVDEVIKNYPPDRWLPTLKLLYSNITIAKAAPAPNRERQPLRPTGAKPGAKAPGTMEEAISQGLGYAKAS